MYWHEAVRLSKVNIAVRNCGGFTYILRHADGTAQKYDQGRIREAYPQEIEGFIDWQPYGGKNLIYKS